MNSFSWSEFFVLFGLGIFGSLAILPYSLSLSRDKLSQAKLPLPVLMLLSVVQTAILIALATGLGLLAAQPVGLGAPLVRTLLAGRSIASEIQNLVPPAIGLGVASFILMILFERFVFASHVPTALRESDVNTSPWKRFLASFYGGIDEEILMRLFLVSGITWVLSRFWQNPAGLPATGAYWTAIIITAVIFGLGHLPATRSLTPITTMLVLRAVVLNGIAGIAFGWLYWQYGLVAAMLSHFTADILLHLIGPRYSNHVYQDSPAEMK